MTNVIETNVIRTLGPCEDDVVLFVRLNRVRMTLCYSNA